MFEQLMNLIKGHSQNAIVNNPDVPNEHNEAVMNEAGNSITGTLQNLMANGNIKSVMSLFGGQQANVSDHPVTQQISGNFIQNLMSKFGLNQQQATNVSDGVLPQVMNNLVKKTNDPSDNSFDIQSIFNKLSGGNTNGMNIQGMLSKFTGGALDKDGDGDTDLNDLKAAFSGTGGGIIDKIKGMFGS